MIYSLSLITITDLQNVINSTGVIDLINVISLQNLINII